MFSLPVDVTILASFPGSSPPLLAGNPTDTNCLSELFPSSRPWLLSSSSSEYSLPHPIDSKLTVPSLSSAVLMQNARKASAALLPALTTPLPPSMVMPKKL